MVKHAAHIIVLFCAFHFPASLFAMQPDETTPKITVLYDGELGGTPDTQGFSYVAFATSASQSYSNGVTMLDTTAVPDDQAGYFAKDQPSLDRKAGYAVQFKAQIEEENHASPHRAGFSVIVLSSDLQGIELGFWSDEIWAQEGGTSALFTHAEGINFDTTAALIEYELQITADTYTLSVDGTAALSGALRDYTAFEGILDPYETPNLLFLGDNTSRGQAKVDIAYVSLQTKSQSTSTPSPKATVELTATLESTSTPTATKTPAATATIPPAPTPGPARAWYWWLPFTSGYPSQ